jgi:GNAT superfamily N-acetyltransferase
MRSMLIRDVRQENGLDHVRRHAPATYSVRRELRTGDADAIVAMHDRIYPAEYARNEAFVQAVADSVAAAVAAGWPEGGGVWIVESRGRHAGSVALTAEGDGTGKVRWVLLESSLRGAGIGRRLIGEAVDLARELGMRRLELDTFSELRAAAKIYRDVGFRVVGARERSDWGPTITYQQYALDL